MLLCAGMDYSKKYRFYVDNPGKVIIPEQKNIGTPLGWLTKGFNSLKHILLAHKFVKMLEIRKYSFAFCLFLYPKQLSFRCLRQFKFRYFSFRQNAKTSQGWRLVRFFREVLTENSRFKPVKSLSETPFPCPYFCNTFLLTNTKSCAIILCTMTKIKKEAKKMTRWNERYELFKTEQLFFRLVAIP